MASKRAVRRKSCRGKIRFDTDETARAAIGRLRRATGTNDFLTSYRCTFCGGFHYGHPPQRVRQAIRDRSRA